MRTVHIYVESDSVAPRSMRRQTGYVLEYIQRSGEPYTVAGFAERTGTYNAVILQTIIEAMERITKSCEIHLHSQNCYILRMIDRNLPIWANNGYRTAKGGMVANHFEWQKLWEIKQRHLLIGEPGGHSYYFWILGEMGKRKEAGASSIY